jgi:hypothetical protein
MQVAGSSDGGRELVEGRAEPVAPGGVGGEFTVAAAGVPRQRMPGGRDPHGPAAFQAAHRP